MAKREQLPHPHLDARLLGARRVPALVDERLARQTGVRIAFTGRAGGESRPPYDALNLGAHVGDDPASVARNRAILLEAAGAPDAALVVPNQVHGTCGVVVGAADAGSVERARAEAAEGADYLAVEAAGVAALLCFADCAPVIIVSPTGRFAVAHAGWRGAVAGIAGAAARHLARLDAVDLGPDAARAYNAYLGPHIRSECFECGSDVVRRFEEAFGPEAAPDARHVSLAAAVTADLVRAGLEAQRIADAGVCTKCQSDAYFSYRASGGVCGRHGALAVRTR